MSYYEISAITKLAEYFEKMPSVSRKSASRMAYSILKMPKSVVEGFSKAILEAREKVGYCKVCCDFTDKEICRICSDNKRDKTKICVVEEPKDVIAIEKTHEFDALYHVLHGVISPLGGIDVEQIKIKELIERVKNGGIEEVILAVNPTVEGEATSMYIAKILKPLGVKVTRLAYGIPVGASLEFADEITLSRSLKGRGEI